MNFKLFCQLLLCSLVSGSTLPDLNKLLADKKANYNQLARPVANQSHSVNVGVMFQFLSLQEFDEVGETISIVGCLLLSWMDQMITWTPSEYGGLNAIAVESSRFWKPKLVLVNSAGKFEAIDSDWLPIRFTAFGLAVYTPGSIFKATCSVDVTYYPWDEQTCTLIFTPWGFFYNEISFNLLTTYVGLKMAGEHGVWDITNTSTFVDKGDNFASQFNCQFKLRRKAGFIVLNVLLPVVLMSVLNVLIFLIPIESGERFSYCLTVLLAIAVFMTLIGENLPKRSSPMSLLGYYLSGVLLNSVAIVLATIGSYRVYCRDTDIPVSTGFTVLVRLCRYNIAARRRITTNPNYKQSKTPEPSESQMRHCHALKLDDFADCITNYGNENTAIPSDTSNALDDKQSILTDEKDNFNVVTWKQVARSLDKLVFVVFSLILIGTTTVFVRLIYLGNGRL